MTAASGASSVASSPLPKWQLALAVGAPVALGLGYMYYKRTTKSSKPDRGKAKNTTRENGTSTEKQISIDGEFLSKDSSTPSLNETPLEKAKRYKDEGNACFKVGKYDEAIAHYNNAIVACPEKNTDDLSILYQNRAAAYEQLGKYSAVKNDCTKALELKPKYVKALIRRAKAMVHINELEPAVEDITAALIFEHFSNQMVVMMADKVLKQLGKQHAEEHLATKKLIMPSKYFIKTYISSFHKDPVFSRLKDSSDNNLSTNYSKIIKCLREQNYDNIISLCTEEIERLESDTSPSKMELLLLRATFYLLLGKHDAAIEDFATIINNDATPKEVKANALIKRATLYMQLVNPQKCFSDFEMAAKVDPDCGDLYHQRGQVNLLLEKIDEAKLDFTRAVELNPDFGVAYVQKCYADYRYSLFKQDMGLMESSIKAFDEAFLKFPDCSECYVLYAQVLTDSNQYEKADHFFASAIERDPENATVYVHRGLLRLRWDGDVEKAVEYINKAIELDDKCEFGYETLGSIEVQKGNFKKAIELFDKALELGRTTMELTHIFSLRDAAKAQIRVTERFGADILNATTKMMF